MNGKYTVGVDLGGTKILSAVVNPEGKILSRCLLPTRKDKNTGGLPDKSIEEHVCTSIDRAIQDAQISESDIMSIGIGVAGLVDHETGTVHESPNIPQFRNLNLKEPVEAHFSIPCFVDNDVNLGTYGEYSLGAAMGYSDVVGIFIGTGIGGGIIIDGCLHHGFNKTAGEIGFITVKYDGSPHPGGSAPPGTLEAYSGRAAFKRDIEPILTSGDDTPLTRFLLGRWVDFDPERFKKDFNNLSSPVREMIFEKARIIGYGTSTLIHVLSPEVIVYGGGVMSALGELLLPQIENAVKERTFRAAARNVRLKLAELGDDAGILGAARYAADRIKKSRQ